MKILCVIDSLGSGGAQRQLVELGKGFKEKGHEVFFIVYHENNFYKNELDTANIPVMLILEENPLKRIFKMRKVIRSQKPDAVLSFLEVVNFITTLSGFPYKKWKLIVGERSANPKILKSFRLRFYRFFHLFVDAVVANSYENIKMIQKINFLIPRNKLVVIYNTIDLEKWKLIPGTYQFKVNGKFNLVIVASHQSLKNLNGLVQAVELLSDTEKKGLKVNWYGGKGMDDSKNKAIKLIKQNNLTEIFEFHEPISDIQNVVRRADALGLFSFYEGLPNTVCEAMILGKPIIASKVSDIPLLINNKNLLCEPSNINSICNSLKYLLAMKEIELSQEGDINFRKAKMLFNRENIINDYLKLLQ